MHKVCEGCKRISDAMVLNDLMESEKIVARKKRKDLEFKELVLYDSLSEEQMRVANLSEDHFCNWPSFPGVIHSCGRKIE